MNKIIILIFCFLNFSYFCYAQPPQEGRMKRAEMVMGNFLEKELNLTPDEAEKLKPVYKSYFMDIRNARKEDNSDPLATEEKILNIRKKYKTDFKKILGTEERVNKLLLAEKKFRDILRKELIERRLNRSGRIPGIQ